MMTTTVIMIITILLNLLRSILLFLSATVRARSNLFCWSRTVSFTLILMSLPRTDVDYPICISYGVFNIAARRTHKQGGYCNNIIGNQPIIATLKDMFHYDNNMWRWQYQAVSYRRAWLISEGKKSDRRSEIDQCFKQIDDIYCHYYYKRCYIDSKPQPICREACEELEFKHCKLEFREALKMNFERRNWRIYQYHWVIINCTTLPYRNETTNCYYPNHDQGGWRKRLLANRNLSVIIVIFVNPKLVSAS